jgi:hypothetical protein
MYSIWKCRIFGDKTGIWKVGEFELENTDSQLY